MKDFEYPIVDLSGLSLWNQTLEYFDRRKAAKANPDKCTLVRFYIHRAAREVADSIIDDKEMFFTAT